jgi:hypothetical protein
MNTTPTNVPVPPSDINNQWLKIARRMESCSKQYPLGYSVVNLAILVNSQGLPVFWAHPIVTPIEPGNSDAVLHYLQAALRLSPLPKPDTK